MKISKYLWVEKGSGFNRLRMTQLKMQNKCKGHLYLVCTSYNNQWLFEIIESRFLTEQYKECYLVGVTSTKEAAVHYVGRLIHDLYNLKTISYDKMKT